MGQYIGMGMSAMQSAQGIASSLSAMSALPSQEQAQSDAARSQFMQNRNLLTSNLASAVTSQAASHSKRGETWYF